MITEEKVKEIIALREKGLTYAEISKETEVSVGACWKYCHPIAENSCMVEVGETWLTRLNELLRKVFGR